MKAVQVQFSVKEEFISSFIQQTHYNVDNSRKEPGVKDFLFFQNPNDLQHFYLIEVYQTAEDQAKHRNADHYIQWKKNILPMLTEPYSFTELNYL